MEPPLDPPLGNSNCHSFFQSVGDIVQGQEGQAAHRREYILVLHGLINLANPGC